MSVGRDVLRQLVDPHMQKIYMKACSEGTREVYRTRIMLVGHYAAGKTSVKRSLLNEEFVPDYRSTKGVETEEAVGVFTTHVTKDGKGSYRWQKVWSAIFPTCIYYNYDQQN